MKDMEHSKRKGLVKQYTNQAEKIFNENRHNKNPAMKKYMLGEALTKINLAIEMGMNTAVTARAYCMRAKIYKAQGDLGNAIKDYTVALELSKGKDWNSLFEIGNIYFEREEDNSAIEYYTRIIDMFDAPPYVYGKRAMAYKKAGKLKEAERDEETANLPEWFFNINPGFYETVANILRGKHPEIVRYIPAGEFRDNPNGTIVFGPRMAERAFDAKTGEFLWLS
jgi:tetratricopeptide (TPR) repeat protein